MTERVHVLIFLQLKAAEEIKIKAAETEKQLQLDLAQIKADQENLDNVTIAEEVSVTKSNSTSDVASQHLSTIQHILFCGIVACAYMYMYLIRTHNSSPYVCIYCALCCELL